MSEPIITCPNCNTAIKLTDSIAASLIAPARKHYEKQMAEKDQYIAGREKMFHEKEKQLADEKKSIESLVADKVSKQLGSERAKIIAEETKRARLVAATDLEQITRILQLIYVREI